MDVRSAHGRGKAVRGPHGSPCDRAIGALLIGALGAVQVCPARGDTIEEIIVTARKSPEAVGTVPLAVTVLPRDVLQSASIINLGDIAAHTPGLSFEPQFAAGGGMPTIRGQAPNLPGDNVGVFVDGVFQALQEAYDVELLDMERVEVLRGPQNSLFGHSTFAGAIHYVPRAPTPAPEWGTQIDAGSDAWRGAQGWLSGPLAESGWLGRAAAAWRGADGTLEHAMPESLGRFDRHAWALALARDASPEEWRLKVTARRGVAYAELPYQSTLEGDRYNCGSQNPGSGQWTYYCGRPPISDEFELSAGLPESESRSTQAAISLDIPLGPLRLESLGSWYRGTARVVRDFDGRATGTLYGTCTPGVNCPGGARSSIFVNRLVGINQVRSQHHRAEELSQEVRVSGRFRERVEGMLGAVYFRTERTDVNSIGAARGDVAPYEQLTSYLPGTPLVAGPVSLLNLALVDDPNAQQIEQSRDLQKRRTWAVFGSMAIEPAAALRLRAEWRYERERQSVEGVTVNFGPGLGKAFETAEFDDVTPRYSIDYTFGNGTLLYASAAKGSRSGGINTIPGLLPEERTWDPEYNWTYETGLRYSGTGPLQSFQLTLFAEDWSDVQGFGFSATPDIANQIVANTSAISSHGIETALVVQPVAWLRGELAYSQVEARFQHGSDDPSVRAFCGLVGANTTSNFCTVGPPRHGSSTGLPLVPWIDDNFVSRTPERQWAAALEFTPAATIEGARLSLRVDVSHQEDFYDRTIEGLQLGSRTLVGGRIALLREAWSIELWGRNLTDDRYHRTSISRGNLFFATTTRPVDLLYGEGRRVGLTVRYTH